MKKMAILTVAAMLVGCQGGATQAPAQKEKNAMSNVAISGSARTTQFAVACSTNTAPAAAAKEAAQSAIAGVAHGPAPVATVLCASQQDVGAPLGMRNWRIAPPAGSPVNNAGHRRALCRGAGNRGNAPRVRMASMLRPTQYPRGCE